MVTTSEYYTVFLFVFSAFFLDNKAIKKWGVFMRWFVVLGIVASLSVNAERTQPGVFYMDSAAGNDLAEGTSPEAAWKSLMHLNRQDMIPGDKVLFKCGGLWRGQLLPKSGSVEKRVFYGSYGEGPKPIIQASLDYSADECWRETRPGIWSTVAAEVKINGLLVDLKKSQWGISYQETAKGTFERIAEEGREFYRIKCTHPGEKSNLIQIWGPMLTTQAEVLQFKFRARSTKPFRIGGVESMLNHPPWTKAFTGVVPGGSVDREWKELTVNLQRQNGILESALHFALGGVIPQDARFDFEPVSVCEGKYKSGDPIPCDVGCIILDHGKAWGVKKWDLASLKEPLDYWYDPVECRVHLRMDGNPGQLYASAELALKKHIVSQGGCHDITYDGLAIRYGAAHGFGGHGTANITIRNCDICWIGGALQHMRADGHPVRYGNGIEFWNCASNNLVENNRIWEIYDAALTNQGKGGDRDRSDQIGLIYRNNLIWNAEYSFEYWNRPESARTENILFEHNTCVDAGSGWAHSQRPDRNGAHLMFYHNPAQTKNLVVRNNIFVNSTEVITRMENDWRAGLLMQNNLLYQDEKPIMRWLVKTYYGKDDFTKYRQELQLDQTSQFAKPEFGDPAKRDYTLKSGSVGTTLATDGGCAGVR